MSLQARKRFGQHFLTDEYFIQQIISVIAPQAQQHIVEIGPGLGALTKHLLPLAGQLTLIEIDRDLIPKLHRQYQTLSNLHIIQADALSYDFTSLSPKPLRICGNLPYNISTPLLFHLLQQVSDIQDMHFMLQKEVVSRLCAAVNTPSYGRLSIMVQYFCQAFSLLDVPPDAFSPPPRVNSSVVRLQPYRQLPIVAQDFTHFANIVRIAFNQRRKTLRNVFKGLLTQDDFAQLALDPMLRPEQLSITHYVKISNMVLSQELHKTKD